MAYNEDGLVKIATGGAIAENAVKSLFLYASNDALATIAASGYFNSAAAANGRGLNDGDLILVAGVLNGTKVCQLYVASVAANGTVTTAAAA